MEPPTQRWEIHHEFETQEKPQLQTMLKNCTPDPSAVKPVPNPHGTSLIIQELLKNLLSWKSENAALSTHKTDFSVLLVLLAAPVSSLGSLCSFTSWQCSQTRHREHNRG